MKGIMMADDDRNAKLPQHTQCLAIRSPEKIFKSFDSTILIFYN
jgi:hypothetical protein